MEKPLSGAGGMTHCLRALASLADDSRHEIHTRMQN